MAKHLIKKRSKRFFGGKYTKLKIDNGRVFAALLAMVLATPVLAFQSAEVYRWVDDNGNVHFSDMPRDKNAKLFFVKPGLTSKADTVQLPEANATAVTNATTNESAEFAFMETPNSAEACRDLRVLMSQRARDLNSGNPEKAVQARMFLEQADKLLIAGNC